MSYYAYLGLYCLAIIAASLVGGWIPLHIRLTHQRLQLANSLIGGFMLGVALLSLLPHALESGASVQIVVAWMTAGVLTMFLLERFFHFHQHDLPSHPPAAHQHPLDLHHDHAHNHDHKHDHSHSHAHGPACDHGHEPRPIADCDEQTTQAPHYERRPRLSWSGAAVGLVLHCLIGGIALGAAITADQHVAWPGLMLFLVILLHKPFDSMTLLALIAGTGWSRRTGHLVNAVFALVVPFGAVLFLLGFADEHDAHSLLVGNALAFAAGVFLCIALSDVLPELHFHRHDKVKLSLALIVGLSIAWAIAHFEMQNHEHHGHDQVPVPHDHDGDGVADH